MSEELKPKLQFGWYSVKMPQCGSQLDEQQPEQVLCKPLSQADYSEGWQAVLPKKRKDSTIYNWNVNLAQLPPHLWHRCHTAYNKEGKEFFKRITDGIYLYSVVKTEHDDTFIALNKELSKPILNSEKVRSLYNLVKDHTSGWLVMRANKYLNEHASRIVH